MIITSTQQIEEIVNPSNALDLSEFENITLKFVIEDKKTQSLYFKILGEDNLQIVLKAYISCTPNIYKKIFRSKFNKKKKIE